MTRREALASLVAATMTAAASVRLRGQAPAASPAAAAPADRWAKEIAAFVKDDEANPFPQGGIVFTGSSSIRLWDLGAAFPGRRLLNRGFGGTQIVDSVNHVDRLVLRHRPSTVIFYAGDNDIASDRTPQQVDQDFRALVAKIHAALPAARVGFVGIKPSLARWSRIAQVREANRLVRAFCDGDDRLGFIDVDGPMLGWDGKPRADLFVKDGLHLSPKGYALWNVLVAPFLE
jgi:lysophospholipase L1-like esterase